VPVGTVCRVGAESEGAIEAEVIGFRQGRTLMMNLGGPAALLPGARVQPVGSPGEADVGSALLGRVVDGAGKPIDGLGPIRGARAWPLAGKLQSPLDRGRVREPLDVGVRAINGLLTLGQGQRVGIMAGSGVGKSVLLGMMVKAAAADVVVIGLIGERSREVADFLETKVAGAARARSVVVAVPANHSPVLRIRGALRAHAIAEAFRAEGKRVLLIMDSLTRVAHAGREIGLALGEPASARGYPPSAIAIAPQPDRTRRRVRHQRRFDHRDLHRAGGRGRRQRPGGRRSALDPGRSHRAVARAGRARHLSRD
jgi:flagellum-specific ATP synthase